MTHIPETQLALYAGGELEARSIAPHLENCPECRRKAGEFRLAQAWLKSVAAEPDAGQFYTLRENVLQAVEKRHNRNALWWITASAASLAFVIFTAIIIRPAQKEPAVATVALPPLPTGRASLGPLVLTSRNREGAVRRAPPRLTLVAKNSESMPVVRVRTSDPNVVILWVVGSGSEEENKNE
jgi:anti-sigma factor RsiW